MSRRILALWLPNWPVQRLVRDRPELATCALVLYEQDARYGQRVKACSAAAWEQAVRPGMPLAEAQTLLESNTVSTEPTGPEPTGSGVVFGHLLDTMERACPKTTPDPFSLRPLPVLFVGHDARRDRESLVELAEWCGQFSPLVGLDETDEPDSLLLDVGGLAHLFGGEEALARTVVTACRQQNLTARVAIADTLGAAWGFARWSKASTDDMQSASAAIVVIPSGKAAALDDLPVDVLRLSPRTSGQLHRLGVRRIGQLNRLPRASLAARFGELLLERLDKLTGAIVEPLVAHHACGPLAVCGTFEHPTTRHEAIEHVLAELLGQLSRRLLERGQGVLRLICQLVCQNRRPLNVEISLFRPTIAPQHLLALARLQLALLTLPDAVEEIRVRAVMTAPCEQRQGELFGDAPRERPAQLALLIERLSNRLGRERVVAARLQADPQAELAYRYQPLAGESASSSAPALPPLPQPGPLLRPFRLFDPPQPIDVVGIALDGPPAMFHYQRRQHRVARCFGPERIETGWWRGESSRRDYYRVETDSGNRWWLFRQLQDQRWFLQGVFE